MFNEIKQLLTPPEGVIPEKHRDKILPLYVDCISEVDILKRKRYDELQRDSYNFRREQRFNFSEFLQTASHLVEVDSLEFNFSDKGDFQKVIIRKRDNQADSRPFVLDDFYRGELYTSGGLIRELIWLKIADFEEFRKFRRVIHLTPDNSPNFHKIVEVIRSEISSAKETFYCKGNANRSGVKRKIEDAVRPVYTYVKDYPDDFPKPFEFLSNLFKTNISGRYLKESAKK